MMITRKISAMMRIWVLFMLIVPTWAGAKDLFEMCIDCHGEDGLGTESDMPIIAGEAPAVQEDAIYAYADGDRQCISTPMMCKISSRLTEEQIVEYSAYFARLPYKAACEEFDPAIAEAGQKIHASSCAKCHGADDPSEADDSIGASKLHGQRKDYLRYALERYVAGERNQLPKMEKVIVPLSTDDIEALVHYYATYCN